MASFFGACGIFGIVIPLCAILSFAWIGAFRMTTISRRAIRTRTLLCAAPLLFGVVLTGLKYVYMPQEIGTADSSVARAMKDIYLSRMWYPVYLGGVCALLPAVLFAAQWILIKPGNQQPPASL